MFDVQGAMSAGMIAAWLRRPDGRLSKETHTAGDLAADFEVESLHDVTRLVELTRGAVSTTHRSGVAGKGRAKRPRTD
jgi:hypothetical protein